jgi:excisionase family DNA binding protein
VNSDSDILTVQEVAADLQCSKAHVCKLVNGAVKNTSRLPAIRLGRRILVRRVTLELWKRAIEQGTEIDDMMRPSGKGAVGAWKEVSHA